MATIWKYPLEETDVQTIQMPWDAVLLHVGVQQGYPTLWAMVEPTNKLEPRRIRIVGTGHNFTEYEYDYIGTVIVNPFVWHIFEDRT